MPIKIFKMIKMLRVIKEKVKIYLEVFEIYSNNE
jgi:hypothetical protein